MITALKDVSIKDFFSAIGEIIFTLSLLAGFICWMYAVMRIIAEIFNFWEVLK